MADTPEKKIKKKVVTALKQMGTYYFYPVTGGFGASGIPDIVACYKGRFIGIECKADATKKGPTALQTRNLLSIEENGGVSLVIDKYNVDAVAELIKLKCG